MNPHSLIAVAASLLLVGPLVAQDGAAKPAHPDFNGTWVMDPAKSAADGQLPLPTSATFTITQHGDSLVVVRDVDGGEGKTSTKMVFGIDGKNWANTIPTTVGPIDLSTAVSWDKATLRFVSTSSYSGTDIGQTESWALSPDGKVLTLLENTSVGGQDYGGLTMVFVRKT